MSNARNGQHLGSREPSRRLRLDDVSAIELTAKNELRPDRPIADPAGGHSGRRLVILAAVTVLLFWGGLYLVFRDWRARYRARADFGRTQVVPAIDGFDTINPGNVDLTSWQDAVAETRSVLSTVISSNLLDVPAMKALRMELDQAVARARSDPSTAVMELAGIWNRLADRGEFLLRDSRSALGVRHARPRILPPRPAVPRPASADAAGDRAPG